VDALLSRSEDLAKGWLLALLERAPLNDAPRIMAAELTRDGPRVCDAIVRAIADDTDERRLEPGGALVPLAARVGELAGAGGAEATSKAVDALQAVVWDALRSELRNPEPDLIAELAERLAQVTELVRVAALRHGADAVPAGSGGPALAAVGTPDEAVPHASPEPAPAWGGGEASGREPDALWVRALQEEIQRSAGSPLSLLLAELEDADRMLAVETKQGSAATLGHFAQAIRGAVRRQDILVCETDARAWIIARETGRAGAQALGERISAAVSEGQPWRGAPMAASVGVAVLGEDGRSSSELIDAAEESRFAAAADGLAVIRAVPEDAPADR